MRQLSIDIETYSSVSLKDSGLYKYVQSADFEILLFAYAFDNEEVKVLDLARGEQLSEELIVALQDNNVVKTAYNASFEWYALNKFWKSPIEQWRCTMVKGLYCGYPAGLDAVGKAIGLAEEKQKLAIGKALIRYFCIPCNATKANGGRVRNLPGHEPEKWELFKEYCKQDVVTEIELKRKLDSVQFPEFEQKMWVTDMIMNVFGVEVDRGLIQGALVIDENYSEELMQEAKEISGLDNPNSPVQLKDWLSKELGIEVTSLTKEDVPKLLESATNGRTKRILEIRQELSKTSTKKYQAMENAVGTDNRVRGLLQFYGANRTGRWAGRLVQVQNLPQNHLEPLDLARDLVKNQKIETLKVIYRKYLKCALTIN